MIARRYPRYRELLLLGGATAVVWLGFLQLEAARGTSWSSTSSLLMSIIPIIGVLTHMYLSRAHPGADMLLLPSSCTLAGIGLIVVDRLRPELAIRQAVWLLLGLLGIVAGCWIAGHRDWLLRYRYTIGAAGIALTTATLILGVDPNGSGARLWFSVGGVSLQPVELMKVLLVIWLSGYLYEHGEVIRLGRGKVGPFGIPPLPYLAPLGIVLLLSELLLVVQRDLGAGLLLSLVFTLTIYAATARISVLVLGLGSLVGAGWLSRNLFSHVALRISIWLDPWSQSDGAGFQVIQGLIALANGGILGTGLGLGSPTLVPAIHTDFSIAAISEELGLAGALGVLALYAVLLNRCFRISLRHADRYGQILATGLSTVLGVQTLLILGGVLKLLPLTGITLPWISYGGSSILANALILGMLLRLSSEIADDA